MHFLSRLHKIYRVVGYSLEVSDAVHHLGNASAVCACDTGLCQLDKEAVYLVLIAVDNILVLDYDVAGFLVVAFKELQRLEDSLSCELCHLICSCDTGVYRNSRSFQKNNVQTCESPSRILDFLLAVLDNYLGKSNELFCEWQEHNCSSHVEYGMHYRNANVSNGLVHNAQVYNVLEQYDYRKQYHCTDYLNDDVSPCNALCVLAYAHC